MALKTGIATVIKEGIIESQELQLSKRNAQSFDPKTIKRKMISVL
jgi:hypothetical protein